jgi:(2Fe-2S) ferredoxin
MADIYKYHLFFCTHERDDGKPFCQQHDAQNLRNYAKQRVKELGLKKVRVNNAGCLNRCALGPMLVIYPEGTWYQYHSQQDIDDIIQRHLIQGEIVERLRK